MLGAFRHKVGVDSGASIRLQVTLASPRRPWGTLLKLVLTCYSILRTKYLYHAMGRYLPGLAVQTQTLSKLHFLPRGRLGEILGNLEA